MKSHSECVIELIELTCGGEKKKMECVIRGYHVYKAIWAAAIGEELVCTREATNAADGNERRNHHWTLTKTNF